MLSFHCVSHRCNLAILRTSRETDCLSQSDEIDELINSVADYFKKSTKCKEALERFHEEFADSKKFLKRVITR